MPKTLIARIKQLEQYNALDNTLLWQDPSENRWVSPTGVYTQLNPGDNAIIIAPDKLLIGTLREINNGQSLNYFEVREVIISNDRLLQLHEFYPELNPRVKANFKLFIHSKELNIDKLIADANAHNFISYYILSGIAKYQELFTTFKENDRIILLNGMGQFENVKLHSNTGLTDFPSDSGVMISVTGLTVNDALQRNKDFKRASERSNNVTRLENIQRSISANGLYKFHTFFSYHDTLFNRKVYGYIPATAALTTISLLEDERVYKVSMSAKELSDEAYDYARESNLFFVHSDTKSKGTSSNTQADTFSTQMKPGDYFYLCRGNSYVEVIGKISGEPVECEYEELGNEGWLQRSYQPIAVSVKDGPYVGKQKWWTPNDNSTCIEIPENEITDANDKLFIPFFNTQFKYSKAIPALTNDNNMKEPSLNQILFGPPGTGKTYNTVNKALELIGENIAGKSREEIKTIFDAKIREEQIVFTTFHQSLSYEDFIEGIKPLKPLPDSTFLKYDVQPGIFKKICESARSNYENAKKENKDKLPFETAFEKLLEEWEDDHQIKFPLKTEGYDFTIGGFTSTSIQFIKSNGSRTHTLSINTLKELYYGKIINFKQGVGIYYPAVLKKLNSYSPSEPVGVVAKSFVLIIDEINRGNVSQIFGELITLIEEDKRMGMSEWLEVALPNSPEKFSVPPNLYIIGTMNTADRSVEALDAALRRRFSFHEMPPDSNLIVTAGKLKSTQGILGNINLPTLLDVINNRIEKLLDKDHKIGHSYFLSVATLEDLKLSFHHKILPLLQEYFFGDLGKIGLVLGEGFFVKQKSLDENIFADFEDYDASGFNDRPVYKFKNIAEMPDEIFTAAINILLKKKIAQ